jgi:hypothetical protein
VSKQLILQLFSDDQQVTKRSAESVPPEPL